MAKTLDQNLTMVVELKDMFSSPAKTISQAAQKMSEDNKKLQTSSEGGASTAEKNAKALQDLAKAAQEAATAEAAAAGATLKEGEAEKSATLSSRERTKAIRDANVALKEQLALNEANAKAALSGSKVNLTNTKASVVDGQASVEAAKLVAAERRRLQIEEQIIAAQRIQTALLEKMSAAIARNNSQTALASKTKELADKRAELAAAKLSTAEQKIVLEQANSKRLEDAITAAREKGVAALNRQGAAIKQNNSAAATTPKAEGGGTDLIKLYSIGSLATQLAGLATSLAAIVWPVTKAGEFARAMDTVRAVADASDSSFQTLSASMLDLGYNTEFTAVEAAKAAQAYAAAGYKVSELVGSDFNAIGTTLQLAQIGMISTDDAANILIKTLSSFSIPISDIARVGDVMAKAANETNSSVQDLGHSLSYVGPVAGALGMSLEEVITPLALMSNYGMKGSMAGTALRGTLTALINPTKEEAKIMAELGKSIGQTSIQIYDAQGKFAGISNIMKQFETAGLSAGQAMEIFGDRAGTGFAALMKEGSNSITEFESKLNEVAGSLQFASDTIGGNLVGDWNKLTATINAAAISIGGTFLPASRALLQGLQYGTKALGEFTQANQSVLSAVASVAAAFGTLVVAVKGFNAAKGFGSWLISDMAAMVASVTSGNAVMTASELELAAAKGLLAAAETLKAEAALAESNAAILSEAATLRQLGSTTSLAVAKGGLALADQNLVVANQEVAIAQAEVATATEACGTTAAFATGAIDALAAAEERLALATRNAAVAQNAQTVAAEGLATANAAAAAITTSAGTTAAATGTTLAGIWASITSGVTTLATGFMTVAGYAVMVTGAVVGIAAAIGTASTLWKSFQDNVASMGAWKAVGTAIWDMVQPDKNIFYKWFDSTAIGQALNDSIQKAFARLNPFGPDEGFSFKVFFEAAEAENDLRVRIDRLKTEIDDGLTLGLDIPDSTFAELKKLESELAKVKQAYADSLGNPVVKSIDNAASQRQAAATLTAFLKQEAEMVAKGARDAANAIKEATASTEAAWSKAYDDAAQLSKQLVNLQKAYDEAVVSARALVSVDTAKMKTALKNMWDNVFTGLDMSKMEQDLAKLNTVTYASEQQRAAAVAATESKIRELRISSTEKAVAQMNALLKSASDKDRGIVLADAKVKEKVIKESGDLEATKVTKIQALHESTSRKIAELDAMVAQKKKEGYETALKAAQTNLDAIYAKEKSTADQIMGLRKSVADSETGSKGMIRDLGRSTMSDIDAYNDKMAEINDNIAEGARLMETDYAAGLAVLKQAQSDAKGLGTALKDGENDVVSQADAVKNATDLIRKAQDAIGSGAKASESALEGNLSKLKEEADATEKVAEAYKQKLEELQNNKEIMISIKIDLTQADGEIKRLTEQGNNIVKVQAQLTGAEKVRDDLKAVLDTQVVEVSAKLKEGTSQKLDADIKKLMSNPAYKIEPVVDTQGFMTGLKIMDTATQQFEQKMLAHPIKVTADMTEVDRIKAAVQGFINSDPKVKVDLLTTAFDSSIQGIDAQIKDLEAKKATIKVDANDEEATKKIADIDKDIENLKTKKVELTAKLQADTLAAEKEVSAATEKMKKTAEGAKPTVTLEADTKGTVASAQKAVDGVEKVVEGASPEITIGVAEEGYTNLKKIEDMIMSDIPDSKEIKIITDSTSVEELNARMVDAEETLKRVSGIELDIQGTESVDDLIAAFGVLDAKLKGKRKLDIEANPEEALAVAEALDAIKLRLGEIASGKDVDVVDPKESTEVGKLTKGVEDLQKTAEEDTKMDIDTDPAIKSTTKVEEQLKKIADTKVEPKITIGVAEEGYDSLKKIEDMIRSDILDSKEIKIITDSTSVEELNARMQDAEETLKRVSGIELDIQGTESIDDLIAAFSVLDAKLKGKHKLDIEANPEEAVAIGEALDAIKLRMGEIAAAKDVDVVDSKENTEVDKLTKGVEKLQDTAEKDTKMDIDTDPAVKSTTKVEDQLKKIADTKIEPKITPVLDADKAEKALDDLSKDRSMTLTVNVKATGDTDALNKSGSSGNYAEGGLAFRRLSQFIPGDGAKDDVPALLMKGEYILRKSAVKQYGVGFLNKLNAGQVELPKFASGGIVSAGKSLMQQAKRLKYMNDPTLPITHAGVTYQLDHPTFINSVQKSTEAMQSPLGTSSSASLLRLFNAAIPKMSQGGTASNGALNGISDEAGMIQRKFQLKISQAENSGKRELAKLYQQEANELKKLALELDRTLKQIREDLAGSIEELSASLKGDKQDKEESYSEAGEDYNQALSDIAGEKVSLEEEYKNALDAIEKKYGNASMGSGGVSSSSSTSKSSSKAPSLAAQKGLKLADQEESSTSGGGGAMVRIDRNTAWINYQNEKDALYWEHVEALKDIDLGKKEAIALRNTAWAEADKAYKTQETLNKEEVVQAEGDAGKAQVDARTEYNSSVEALKQETVISAADISADMQDTVDTLRMELAEALEELRNKAAAATAESNRTGTSVGGNALWLNTGGFVPYESGQQGVDSVRAMLTPGEMVIKEPIVRSLGKGFFEGLNAGKLPKDQTKRASVPNLGNINLTFPGGGSYAVQTTPDMAAGMFKEIARLNRSVAGRRG